jgi:hypothetical protein
VKIRVACRMSAASPEPFLPARGVVPAARRNMIVRMRQAHESLCSQRCIERARRLLVVGHAHLDVEHILRGHALDRRAPDVVDP